MRLFLCLLLAVVQVVRCARADPVPDRVDRTEVRPPTSRGLPELRAPGGAAVNLAPLLRSCTRCHGERGPNSQLFKSGRLMGVPLERLRFGVRAVLNAHEEAPWYPTDAERRELVRAAQFLRLP